MKGDKRQVEPIASALATVPKAPSWLPKHAKAEWRRVMPALVSRRILAEHELGLAESYCLTVARIRECEEVIAQLGMTMVTPGGDMKRRPEVVTLKESIEAARRLAAELGLTPTSRAKMGPPPENDDERLSALGFG